MDDNQGIPYKEVLNRLDRSKTFFFFVIAALIAALGGLIFGYDSGITGSALLYVKPYFHLVPIEVSFYTSGLFLAGGIGALVAGPITDKFGRKKMLILDGFLYGVFTLTLALSINFIMLFVSRLMIGFAVGADFAIATAYISEFSPSSSRGRLAITQQLMIFSGLTIAYWTGYFLSKTGDWRLMIGIGILPAVILVSLRFVLPESPRWLALNGKTEQLKKTLQKFNIFIDQNIMPPPKAKPLRENLREIGYKRGFLIVGMVVIFLQISGISVILYFGPTIYVHIGLSGSRAIYNTAISETLGAIFFALSFIFIDKWGRRKLMVLGYGGMVFSMLLMIGGLLSFSSGTVILASIVIFSSITVFLAFEHLGVGGVSWVLQGETMPNEIRGTSAGWLASMNQFSNFAIVFIFPLWGAAYGYISFFELELIIDAFAFVFMLLLLPETKGITLEQIPRIFTGKILQIGKKDKGGNGK
ncbi:MAG: MFS transporter [Thermoplasmataceae archaeon]